MSKITRRSYKRKKIIMGASLFGAIGLVSTGFAAWVLSAPTSKAADPASLNVGEITDKNMEFSDIHTYLPGYVLPSEQNPAGVPTDPSDEFHFEPLSSDKSGRVRYGGEQPESLKLDVVGDLTRVQNLGSITGKITVSDSDKTKLEYAIGKKYIVAPEAYGDTELALWTKDEPSPAVNTNFSYVTSTNEAGDEVMTFVYKVFFQWGEAFDGKNPCEYFDEDEEAKLIPTGTPNDELGSLEGGKSTVGAILKDMRDHLNGITLTLTLTANPD